MLKDIVSARSLNEFFRQLVSFLIVLIISTFIVKFFWNNGLVPHVTVLKPVTSLFDALVLALGLTLLR